MPLIFDSISILWHRGCAEGCAPKGIAVAHRLQSWHQANKGNQNTKAKKASVNKNYLATDKVVRNE